MKALIESTDLATDGLTLMYAASIFIMIVQVILTITFCMTNNVHHSKRSWSCIAWVFGTLTGFQVFMMALYIAGYMGTDGDYDKIMSGSELLS